MPWVSPAGDPKLARLETERIERRINEIETRVRAIDESMLEPKVYADPQKSRQLIEERERLQQELEPLEFEWARRAE
ncbi:MAG: ABC transporter C-terminal domain-containing protein [Planctomycetota bacterium]